MDLFLRLCRQNDVNNMAEIEMSITDSETLSLERRFERCSSYLKRFFKERKRSIDESVAAQSLVVKKTRRVKKASKVRQV